MNFVIFGIPIHICPQEVMAFFASITCLGCAWRWVKAFMKKKVEPKKHEHPGCPSGHPEKPTATDK